MTKLKSKLFNVFFIFIVLNQFFCTENPISTNIENSLMQIDTLTLRSGALFSYQISPVAGSYNRMYLGSNDLFSAPYSFIKINNVDGNSSIYWSSLHDSSVSLDSLIFKLYTDSLISNSDSYSLSYSADSLFSEQNSLNNHFTDFTSDLFTQIDNPLVSSIIDSSDTASIIEKTVLSWDVTSLFDALADTLDSNLVRNFSLSYTGNGVVEFFSREATSGVYDPKIEAHYTLSNDSSVIDTVMKTFYAGEDISLIQPASYESLLDSNVLVSRGLGLNTILRFPFDTLYVPKSSIIKSANLTFENSFDTLSSFLLNIEPLSESLDTSLNTFLSDPYKTLGSFNSSASLNSGLLTLSLKSFLQGVLVLDTLNNFGLKISSSSLNDPFELLDFGPLSVNHKSSLQILYVAP